MCIATVLTDMQNTSIHTWTGAGRPCDEQTCTP